MIMEKYGPFMEIVSVALALIAMFGTLLYKMMGGLKKWTLLTDDTPTFLVALGPRIAAVILMAIIYVIIDSKNYIWFGGAAGLAGVCGLLMISRFDKLRRRHVHKIPLVGEDGKPLFDKRGKPLFNNVVIEREINMRPEAKKAFKAAKKKNPELTLMAFMSGFGQSINDPEAIWDRELLIEASSKLTKYLTFIILCSVMVLFIAALIVTVHNQNSP
jgi:hypothetical protein